MSFPRRKIVLAALLAVPVLIMAGCWAFLTVNVPYWDDYGTIVGYIARPWPERWSSLFDFHNEHRIVTARLAADAVMALGGGVFNFRAMMAAGNLIQLAYAAAWLFLFRGNRFGAAGAVPAVWLLTSFIHYENTCWALCAVQNVIVVALAFAACLLFARRRTSRAAFALSLACATGATFSSGGGLLVWPCLVGMELTQPFADAGGWRAGLREFRRHVGLASVRLALLGAAALAAIGFYLHGFHGCSPEATAASVAGRLADSALFFTAFLGGVLPLYPAALALGAVLLPLTVFFAMRLPRLRRPEVFWFMAAELATMASAAVFRPDPHAAVSSRYCIVSCSVSICLLFLCLEQLPARMMRWCLHAVTAGVMLYTTAFLVLGAPQFARRNEIMRRNILTWPAHPEGLRSCKPDKDGELLRRCQERGVYDPRSVLKEGEIPPEKPEPWLR